MHAKGDAFHHPRFVPTVFCGIVYSESYASCPNYDIAKKIVGILRKEPEMTLNKLVERSGMTSDGIKYHLDKLRQLGRIRHVGPTKKGHWEVFE